MSRVLAIGDPHEPVCRKGYLSFCQDLYYEWRCDRVVIIGDLADHTAISFHVQNPEAPGPKNEYKLAKAGIQKWYKAFPKAKVCIGNHDARPQRVMESVNIPPAIFLRDFNTIWETPKWKWDHHFIIDDVYYLSLIHI